LPEPELDKVAEHLETCAACDAAMRRLDDEPDEVLAALQRPLANPIDLGQTQAFDRTVRHEGFRAAGLASESRSSESGVSDYLRLAFEQAGYVIGEQLGQGGMGIVYRARESALNRDVALKVLLPGSALSPAAVSRFRSEAEAVASLQHPNIVQIHAIGAQDDFLYLSLEFVRGGNLAEMLGGQPLAARKAAALIETLARAIAAAHRQGIVHRDLKPGNILLTPEGAPKITDFGIAKQIDKDQRQTETGLVVGTPGYMAPEQVLARRDQIRPETDIYALGAILYEMLSGRPPFLGVSVHETSPSDDCPVHNVSFLDMIHFCNWLSRNEKRTPCYRSVPDKPGFWKCVASANGYRLPIHAEWIYACRAGVGTMFHFGEDATLLPEYANVLLPRAQPGGMRLPNDWGLFDMLANQWDLSFEPPPRDSPFEPATAKMTLCGGTYGTGSFYSKCESRGSTTGSTRHYSRGFRVFLREGLPEEADSQWLDMETADRLVEQISWQIDKGATPQEHFAGFERLKGRDPAFVAAVADAGTFKELLQRSIRAALIQRRWDKASRYHAAHLELFPKDNFRECQWAMLFAEDPAYPEIRRQLIERWGASAQWAEISRVVKACSLSPAAMDRAELLLEMAVRATRQLDATVITNKPFHQGYCAWVEALALYRVARFQEVLARSDAAQSAPGMPSRMKVSNHLVRAMALQSLGRTKDAQTAYDQALAISLPKEGTGAYADAWNDHHVVAVLLREAAARLGKPVVRFDDLGAKSPAMNKDMLSKRMTGFLQQGDWAKAKNVLLEWIKAFPDDHAEACKLAPLLLIAGDEAGYRDLRSGMLDRYKQTKSWQVAERTAKVCSLIAPEKGQIALILDLSQQGSELQRLTVKTPYFAGCCALAQGLAS